MTDRARLVYALLRTLLAWAPTPRSRTGLDLAPRGFAGGTLRYIACPDCLTNDHPEGMHGCETCGGRGEIPDPGPDPYETKRATRFLGVAGERAADANRRRDLELQRLEQQLARPERREDEPAIDAWTSAVDLRDRLDKTGDYRKLRQALDQLRDDNPPAYQVAMSVAYQPLYEEPIDAVRRVVVQVCELLAVRIDGPIRVPPFVPVSEFAEIERLAREGKGALWRGQNRWADLKRGERNSLIVAMRAEGRSLQQIGLRFNLTRQRVKQILDDRAAGEATATGPAA